MSERAQLRIRNAAELLAALGNSDPGVRMAVLQVVARQPEHALAYGCHEGRDVIDMLLEQAGDRERRGIWEVIVATLAAFRDPRVVEFFKGLLSRARRAQTLFAAAARLRREPIASLQDFLQPLLVQNESDARARAAARLLAVASGLDLAAQVRIALLVGGGRVEPPPLSADTAAAWLAELGGLFGEPARRALEAQGEPALRVLTSCWDQLADGDRVWLLRWGASHAAAAPLIEQALASGSTALTLAALDNVAALGERAAGLASVLTRLATSSEPSLRLAAIQAGATGVDFRAMLASERDPALRRVCLAALAREDGAAALPELLTALRDPDWRVRAAATEAMHVLGDQIAPAIEPLARDPDSRIRTAAVQVLIRLGRDAWLEEELLA